MYNIGLRVGEANRLNLTDLDFKNQKITVQDKGKKRRTLHIDAEMNAILTQWLALRPHFLNQETAKSLFISLEMLEFSRGT